MLWVGNSYIISISLQRTHFMPMLTHAHKHALPNKVVDLRQNIKFPATCTFPCENPIRLICTVTDTQLIKHNSNNKHKNLRNKHMSLVDVLMS